MLSNPSINQEVSFLSIYFIFLAIKSVFVNTENLYMEHVNQVVNFLSRLTEAEKKQANAVTGGNFEKLLVESKVIQTTCAEKNWTKSSINKLENFRTYDIRNIFFLQQKMEKKNGLQIFDKDTPFDLKKLRRDSAIHLKIPTFLEKRFEPFGPTLISKFI